MKKVYVVTHCTWSSYGSMLQALGLQKALRKIAVNSRVIKRANAEAKERIPFKACVKNPRFLLKNLYELFIGSKRRRRHLKTVEFIDHNIDLIYFDDFTQLKNDPPIADAYIAGSDQIWHPQVCEPLFFLDFVPNTVKRISYAASMGVTQIPLEQEERFKNLVKNFDEISVREEDNVDIIRKYTEKDVRVNIDPTFLLSAEEWRTYEQPYKIKKPYILVFAIYWDKSLNAQLKKLAKATNLDIIAICSSLNRVYADKKLYDVAPSEFLWLIDNAEYVITSSFHGAAFSAIFNKKFAAVIDPLRPSRVCSLTKLLSIPVVEIASLHNSDSFDYNEINRRIKLEQKKATDYLRGALEFEK